MSIDEVWFLDANVIEYIKKSNFILIYASVSKICKILYYFLNNRI